MAEPPIEHDRVRGESGASVPSAKFLNQKVADAELLLSYAVRNGEKLDDAIYRSVLEAQRASTTGWTENAAVNLLQALTVLSQRLERVHITPESLRFSTDEKRARRSIAAYRYLGIGLVVPVIIYSAGAFITSSYSDKIRRSLDIANPLAVKLVDELGPAPSSNELLCQDRALPADFVRDARTVDTTARKPGSVASAAQPVGSAKPPSDPSEPPVGVHRKDVIHDLQEFAMAIRDMYGAARQINRIYSYMLLGLKREEYDPYTQVRKTDKSKLTAILELPPGLPHLAQAATERLCVYQKVRYYAQSTEQVATFFSGAIATGILPVLYALLGACAFLLRRFESELQANTLTASEAHSSRFITATIAGAVVGLFNFGQGASVSPLAIAFLVGYSVDVFFTFLESMIQVFTRGRDGKSPGQGTRSSPGK